MKRLGLAIVFACVFSLALLASGFVLAADDSKVKAGTKQVESGVKKIPDGQIGAGVEETAKGIGTTVSEGAKYSGLGENDPTTRRMLEEILAVEEEHAEDLQALIQKL